MHPIFSLIHAISEGSFQPDRVSQLTKHTLRLRRRNPYFEMYESEQRGEGSYCCEIDLRVPISEVERGSFLCLELDDNPLTLTEATAQWGQGTWSGHPPPNDPERPDYYEFSLPTMKLRLAFSRKDKTLVRVVFDAIKEDPPKKNL